MGGYAEEVRSVRGGASPAGGGASRERRRLLQVGWLLLEKAAEIFWGRRFCLVFLEEEDG